MDPTSYPLIQIVEIMRKYKSLSEIQKKAKKGQLFNWIQIAGMIGDTLEELDDQQRSKLNFKLDQETANYHKICRLKKCTLIDLASIDTYYKNFQDCCTLLKVAIENNLDELFCNQEKGELAIALIDEQLAWIDDYVKNRSALELTIRKSTRGGERQMKSQTNLPWEAHTETNKETRIQPTLKLWSVDEELATLYRLLHEQGETVPEPIQEYLWDEEYTQLLAVRKSARFLFHGDDRMVVYSIMEAPATKEVWFVRFGSDYWAEADEPYDCDEDALTIEPLSDLVEAVAQLLQDINDNDDLERRLFHANHDQEMTAAFETRSSLEEKITFLLS